MEGNMEFSQQRRATAQVIANAILLVGIFLGLSHDMVAAIAMTSVSASIFTTVAMLPLPRSARARAVGR
jgi:hypothetical protein